MTAELPEAPTDVRVIRNGVEYPCELMYMGEDDEGFHQWDVVNEYFNPQLGDRFSCATLPAHTGISFPMRPPEDR